MNNIQHIRVFTKKLIYEFDIKRNITVINGNSATGKTTLYDLIRLADGIAIHLECKRKCIALPSKDWNILLESSTDSIIFIDEGFTALKSHEFARFVENSGNYFVIITRDILVSLPYSVKEIYEMKTSGKYHSLVQTYPAEVEECNPDMAITEDKNAGFEFFLALCNYDTKKCLYADGKSKIHNRIIEVSDREKEILIVAGGAAFGCDIGKIMMLKEYYNIKLFLPESFEYLLLQSDFFKTNRTIQEVLQNPYKYITTDYFSWERYFTQLIIKETKDTSVAYTKKGINTCYTLSCCCKEKPCNLMQLGDKIDIVLKNFYNKLCFYKLRNRSSEVSEDSVSEVFEPSDDFANSSRTRDISSFGEMNKF